MVGCTKFQYSQLSVVISLKMWFLSWKLPSLLSSFSRDQVGSKYKAKGKILVLPVSAKLLSLCYKPQFLFKTERKHQKEKRRGLEVALEPCLTPMGLPNPSHRWPLLGPNGTKPRWQRHSLTPTSTTNDLHEVQMAQSPSGRDIPLPQQGSNWHQMTFPRSRGILSPTSLTVLTEDSRCTQNSKFL